MLEEKRVVKISALNNEGINILKDEIKNMFNLEEIEKGDYTYLSSARSISLLRRALSSLNDVEKGIENNMPIDMIEIDLKEVWNLLGEITGENYSEELIDQLFSQFCLGK